MQVAGRDSDFKQRLKEAATSGGVILAGDHAIDPRMLRTAHTTTFQNCNMDLNVNVDAEGVVEGYVMRILDRAENHLYVYGFQQDALNAIKATLMEMPDVGEKLPEQEGPVLQ
jgi:hypothetical protein